MRWVDAEYNPEEDTFAYKFDCDTESYRPVAIFSLKAMLSYVQAAKTDYIKMFNRSGFKHGKISGTAKTRTPVR